MKQPLWYAVIGALAFLTIVLLESTAIALQHQILRTEVYSIHGFSHITFGIGLSAIVLFLRPRSSAKVVLVSVLLVGIAWEIYEGNWINGEPIDSMEDVVLAILSASTFLWLTNRKNEKTNI